jgi:hypothetical protein
MDIDDVTISSVVLQMWNLEGEKRGLSRSWLAGAQLDWCLPTREPQGDAGVMLEDLRRCFKWVLHGVLGMWAHIQDEEVLEQCVGLPVEWRTLICQVALTGAVMTCRMPSRPRGPELVGRL